MFTYVYCVFSCVSVHILMLLFLHTCSVTCSHILSLCLTCLEVHEQVRLESNSLYVTQTYSTKWKDFDFKTIWKYTICFASGFTKETRTYPPSSKQMAAFHCLKDVGSQFSRAGQVGLGQRLLHPLNLHQTQRPLVPCTTHRQRRSFWVCRLVLQLDQYDLRNSVSVSVQQNLN